MPIAIKGMKSVNDNLGHEAGDLLITGAAECVMKALGKQGSLYRVGGDEFAVFMEGTEADVKRVLSDLDDALATWNARHNVELYLSKGCICSSEIPGACVAKLSKEADARMYADKRAFYESRPDLDRRVR